MAIPKHNEMYLSFLEFLSDGENHHISEIIEHLAQKMGVTDEERKIMLSSGVTTKFGSKVGWARTYLGKAGMLQTVKRGVVVISDEGKRVLNSKPAKIDDEFLMQYEGFREFKTPTNKGKSTDTPEDSSQDQTPQENMDSAFTLINSSLGDDILAEIMNRDPRFFESLVVKLLVRMGYGGALEDAGTVTPLSGDDGIDGIIREDKLGFSNIYLQAKRYALDRTVNKPEIQGFVGAIANKAGKGLFITTARFSDGARQCAKENHIVIVDGKKLVDLMIEYGIGVSTIKTYEIKKLDSDFFDE